MMIKDKDYTHMSDTIKNEEIPTINSVEDLNVEKNPVSEPVKVSTPEVSNPTPSIPAANPTVVAEDLEKTQFFDVFSAK